MLDWIKNLGVNENALKSFLTKAKSIERIDSDIKAVAQEIERLMQKKSDLETAKATIQHELSSIDPTKLFAEPSSSAESLAETEASAVSEEVVTAMAPVAAESDTEAHVPEPAVVKSSEAQSVPTATVEKAKRQPLKIPTAIANVPVPAAGESSSLHEFITSPAFIPALKKVDRSEKSSAPSRLSFFLRS